MTDIYIVGTGMVGYVQLTIEARQALDRSKIAYVVDAQRLVKDHIREEYCTDVVDLTTEYTRNEPRKKTYERMAERVLEEAETSSDPVSLALYGHPMVFVSPSRLVVEKGDEMGLDIETMPGISAIDCIYADSRFDPARNGVQMFEATDLLLREWELNPEVPAMVWQVGSVETIRHTTRRSDPSRFERFTSYLQRYYPNDHTVHLLQTATYPIAESQQVDVPLDEFDAVTETVDSGAHILYVPPVRERPVQNEALLERIRAEDHLETITR